MGWGVGVPALQSRCFAGSGRGGDGGGRARAPLSPHSALDPRPPPPLAPPSCSCNTPRRAPGCGPRPRPGAWARHAPRRRPPPALRPPFPLAARSCSPPSLGARGARAGRVRGARRWRPRARRGVGGRRRAPAGRHHRRRDGWMCQAAPSTRRTPQPPPPRVLTPPPFLPPSSSRLPRPRRDPGRRGRRPRAHAGVGRRETDAPAASPPVPRPAAQRRRQPPGVRRARPAQGQEERGSGRDGGWERPAESQKKNKTRKTHPLQTPTTTSPLHAAGRRRPRPGRRRRLHGGSARARQGDRRRVRAARRGALLRRAALGGARRLHRARGQGRRSWGGRLKEKGKEEGCAAVGGLRPGRARYAQFLGRPYSRSAVGRAREGAARVRGDSFFSRPADDARPPAPLSPRRHRQPGTRHSLRGALASATNPPQPAAPWPLSAQASLSPLHSDDLPPSLPHSPRPLFPRLRCWRCAPPPAGRRPRDARRRRRSGLGRRLRPAPGPSWRRLPALPPQVRGKEVMDRMGRRLGAEAATASALACGARPAHRPPALPARPPPPASEPPTTPLPSTTTHPARGRARAAVAMGNNASDGPFSPLVKVVRTAIGQKEFNQLRGKAISAHSQGEGGWRRGEGARAARGARRPPAPAPPRAQPAPRWRPPPPPPPPCSFFTPSSPHHAAIIPQLEHQPRPARYLKGLAHGQGREGRAGRVQDCPAGRALRGRQGRVGLRRDGRGDGAGGARRRGEDIRRRPPATAPGGGGGRVAGGGAAGCPGGGRGRGRVVDRRRRRARRAWGQALHARRGRPRSLTLSLARPVDWLACLGKEGWGRRGGSWGGRGRRR